MIITPQTRISQIIKNTPESVDALIRLNSNFKKLKNPVLRKMLAPRVSVAQAAGIGNVPLSKMLTTLHELGMEVDWDAFGLNSEKETPPSITKADLPKKEENYHYLDVREDLKQ